MGSRSSRSPRGAVRNDDVLRGGPYLVAVPYLVTPGRPMGTSPILECWAAMSGYMKAEEQAAYLLDGMHSGGILSHRPRPDPGDGEAVAGHVRGEQAVRPADGAGRWLVVPERQPGPRASRVAAQPPLQRRGGRQPLRCAPVAVGHDPAGRVLLDVVQQHPAGPVAVQVVRRWSGSPSNCPTPCPPCCPGSAGSSSTTANGRRPAMQTRHLSLTDLHTRESRRRGPPGVRRPGRPLQLADRVRRDRGAVRGRCGRRGRRRRQADPVGP